MTAQTIRPAGCRCRQPGVEIAFHCPVHGLYPVTPARLSDEDRRAIATVHPVEGSHVQQRNVDGDA